MKPGQLGKRLLFSTGGVLLALVVGEVALRLFWPQSQVTDELRYEALPGGDESGPGYRLQPGLWIPGPQGGAINSLGLRGPELGSKSSHRVLVLGDSFVFGAGVATDEALPAQLARITRGEPKPEFVNAGTPGYGTARELAWLESFGAELAPDELLLCVFLGNDFTDNLDSAAPRVVAGQLFLGAGNEDAPGWRLELRAWAHRLHLWRLLERRRLGGAPDDPHGSTSAAPADAAARAAGMESVLAAFARNEAGRLAVYLPADAPDSAAARRVAISYDMTHLALEGIAAWCAAEGAALEVVAIPDVLAVDPALRARAVGLGGHPELEGFDLAGLDFGRPGRELGAWCLELGVPLLDLTPALRERTAQQAVTAAEGLYLFGDSHFNAAGHQFAAELIAAWRRARPR